MGSVALGDKKNTINPNKEKGPQIRPHMRFDFVI